MSSPTLKEIRTATARAFGLTVEQIMSRCHKPQIARPRFAAMYLSRQLTPKSFPQIGRFYDRHHTTVMEACSQASIYREYDSDFNERLRQLEDRFGI